jgi:hypothetical protein
MSTLVSRRRVLAATAAGAIAAPLTTASAARRRRQPLDLQQPADAVLANVKMRASSATRDVFTWFTERLDVAIPGAPIRPMINVESVILRRTERRGPLEWDVIDWEARFVAIRSRAPCWIASRPSRIR